MVETAYQHETKELLTRITALHSFFNKNQDIEKANKARQLAIKLKEQEYSIAFCGHFSAGKSSMINKIVGENLLPSSPIPTSANLVKIKSGEEYAKVYFKKGNPRLYPAPYNYDKVKTFCKDGDQIESIEISHLTQKLPKHAVIMDTPGIDSTDDAHRIATESALHLADMVFYVMDYNHVQSELNFLFTKELTETGKEIYLVINQIDKHRSEELSFDDFKKSVKDSFASWGVHPAEIFYTSLKVEDHPHNHFQKLQSFIQTKLGQREELLPLSIYYSLKKLIGEHQIFLNERNKRKLEEYDKLLSAVSPKEQKLLESKLDAVEQAQIKASSLIKMREEQLKSSVEDVLRNAYLMPFQTRELAETYLQTTQSHFKVGLFFSKQKTEQERKIRLESFFQDFNEKVKSQIEWHLKSLLQNTLKEDDIHETDLISEIQEFSIPVTSEILVNAVKPGALLSGDYLLNYTNDVAEAVKKIAREEVNRIQASYLEQLSKMREKETADLDKEKKQLSALLDAWRKKEKILESEMEAYKQMDHYLSGHFDQQLYRELTEPLVTVHEEVEIATVSIGETENKNHIEVEKEESVKEHTEASSAEKETKNMNHIVDWLRYSANEIHSVPGFKKIAGELLEKAERLEQRGFTVALFGAFSAGKSSFANALIGEKLLPVSPNPTTAAINKILPIDNENSHGTVKVQLKKNNVLFEDVSRSLAVFDLSARDFDDAIIQIKKVMEAETKFDAHEKTHFAFLNAFYKGFEPFRDQLGETIATDITDFRDFVANEEKSCLVEMIEVYYDCELTRKGITLVDTPGADSINARHTGVAFDYIKNSDAILFVTYYNHAFSKADREFLIQLGRVKDTFELDKMFFVVNAVDLANSEEEKQAVLEYVEEQLIKYGIRQPSLFPVSSLLAISEKQDQSFLQSGMSQFEEAFYSFITHDLTDIAINSAESEMKRAVQLLKSFIQSAQEDNEQKEAKIQALKEEQKQIEGIINSHSSHPFVQRLNQEVDELIYYIKQRVFYRFNDFFKEAFNPSVLKDDGRNLKKALQHALESFLADFGFDFAQEMRATTLRVESFIASLLLQAHQDASGSVIKVNDMLSFSSYEISNCEGVSFDSAFLDLDNDLFRKTLSYFKNPKAFFEKNEKKFMMETLEQVLQEPADKYLEREKERLRGYYDEMLVNEFQLLIRHLLEETVEYYEGMYATLSNEIPVGQLIDIEKRITDYHKEGK